ncbi:ArsR family transcriptional regulator [Candidatus Woesearchaeota archaeon]|nr:ArsR family transcriptional regulator [Candidatus Woesearchaeota archaeon]
MLRIFNSLSPFLEDNYREIGVREYARLINISPPTASKMLKELEKEGLLKSREDRRYIFYRADRESMILQDLSRTYWRSRLHKLTEHLTEMSGHAQIVLFGSLTKLEATLDSDIDIFIDSKELHLDLTGFEKNLRRTIQILFKPSLRNRNLKNNIKKGVVLNGLEGMP